MSKARLVITALFVEGQTAAEVAVRYGVHRAWVYKLKARYLAEGEAAFEPRSRRPKTSPRATPAETVELVVRLRKQLSEQGLDAGADTIEWHLQHPPSGQAVAGDDPPDPDPRRRRGPGPREAAEVVVPAVLR
ncbi:helix-turn-helix domain-containing protein [Kribbella sp. NPDC004875]|uniref:helix-turn-helix domain-containing protein n=1 Tax=Kribbella sp. NPDC004875 TaxID=3364107 RepID=UPI0036CD66B3